MSGEEPGETWCQYADDAISQTGETHNCFLDVDLVGFGILGGDGLAGQFVADQRSLQDRMVSNLEGKSVRHGARVATCLVDGLVVFGGSLLGGNVVLALLVLLVLHLGDDDEVGRVALAWRLARLVVLMLRNVVVRLVVQLLKLLLLLAELQQVLVLVVVRLSSVSVRWGLRRWRGRRSGGLGVGSGGLCVGRSSRRCRGLLLALQVRILMWCTRLLLLLRLRVVGRPGGRTSSSASG